MLGTIADGVAVALHGPRRREAASIAFLVALSGVSVDGIGSASWGAMAGAFALFVQQYAAPRPPAA